MLAEELLRAELKKLYGDEVKVFQSNIVADPISLTKRDGVSISAPESKFLEHEWMVGKVQERLINIDAIIGPFERLHPKSPPEDRRRNLRRVKAICRVFSTETGCIWWCPHFLRFSVFHEGGEHCYPRYYEKGFVGSVEWQKDAENPCQDMCDSQTGANYPEFHNLA
ncbi:MAG: hypothetical protein Q8Q97_01925 [bacterium]|nr:hypothetical protein [bacterium]